MYQIYSDNFDKINRYTSIAKKYKDYLKQVYIYNRIETFFGKNYCRIYVDFIFTENTDNKIVYEHQELINEMFSREGISNYFSFYIVHDYENKNDALLNREEEIHYEYIWNLIASVLEDIIDVKAERFESQYSLRLKRNLQ